jgi:hypothetical protein
MQMLEIAGFPAHSREFALLQGQALGEMQERKLGRPPKMAKKETKKK